MNNNLIFTNNSIIQKHFETYINNINKLPNINIDTLPLNLDLDDYPKLLPPQLKIFHYAIKEQELINKNNKQKKQTKVNINKSSHKNNKQIHKLLPNNKKKNMMSSINSIHKQRKGCINNIHKFNKKVSTNNNNIIIKNNKQDIKKNNNKNKKLIFLKQSTNNKNKKYKISYAIKKNVIISPKKK